MTDAAIPRRLGVVVVTFCAADVIAECLESLAASSGAVLDVVVVDNASPDDTRAVVAGWAVAGGGFAASGPLAQASPAPRPVAFARIAAGEALPAPVPHTRFTLIESATNTGFAGGVNIGLRALLGQADIDAFWVLNPDCVVPPTLARAYLDAAAAAPFALMGSRVVYYEAPDLIQTDGGRFSRWTATCASQNARAPAATTPLPDAATLDYISGANMVASRAFIDAAGLLPEEYFVFYEEVDWAQRRGPLPLRLLPGAVVYHHGGSAIGSGRHNRRESPFAAWFNYRNRLWFARKYLPGRAALTKLKALAKAAQMHRAGDPALAQAILAGAFDRAAPPAVAARFPDPATRALALGRHA